MDLTSCVIDSVRPSPPPPRLQVLLKFDTNNHHNSVRYVFSFSCCFGQVAGENEPKQTAAAVRPDRGRGGRGEGGWRSAASSGGGSFVGGAPVPEHGGFLALSELRPKRKVSFFAVVHSDMQKMCVCREGRVQVYRLPPLRDRSQLFYCCCCCCCNEWPGCFALIRRLAA